MGIVVAVEFEVEVKNDRIKVILEKRNFQEVVDFFRIEKLGKREVGKIKRLLFEFHSVEYLFENRYEAMLKKIGITPWEIKCKVSNLFFNCY